jgi:hypothetical protein
VGRSRWKVASATFVVLDSASQEPHSLYAWNKKTGPQSTGSQRSELEQPCTGEKNVAGATYKDMEISIFFGQKLLKHS